MKNFYSIGEVAKILNISTSKLRYYDKNDIISLEIRKENGYRYYSEKQIVPVFRSAHPGQHSEADGKQT